MQQSDKISNYLKTVCEQIRWEKAHEVISEEIENHMLDQIDAFMAEGLDKETAIDKAIDEMGDPVLVGSELDHAHRPRIEWSIIVMTVSILLIGFAVRMFVTYDTGMTPMLGKSIISTVLGIGCMIIAYFLDFTAIGKYPKVIYFGLIIAIIGVMILTPRTNGRYFYAQFILLLFPAAFAGIIYNMRNKGYLGVLLCGVFFAVPGFIGLIIPSISSVILYSLACLILITVAIAKGWFNVKRLSAVLLVYLPALFTAMIIFFAAIFNQPYRIRRLQTAVNPSLDPMGAGYIGSRIRDMIANARFSGPGELGISSGYGLPDINTDFILTYLIHRLGWISFAAVMIVVAAFIIRSFALCSKQKSILGRLVTTSILLTFTIEVIFYAVFNLGFTVISPLALPLISYGGTATIINMILIGIMLSVFKSDDLVRDCIRTSAIKKSKLFEIVDGKLIINFNTK